MRKMKILSARHGMEGEQAEHGKRRGIVRWDRGVEMKKDADLLSSDVMA